MATVLSQLDLGVRPPGVDVRETVLAILTYLPRDMVFREVNLMKALGEAACVYYGKMFNFFAISEQQRTSYRLERIVNVLAGEGYLVRWSQPPRLRCAPRVEQTAAKLRQLFTPVQLQAFEEVAKRIVELAAENPGAK
jgi:hypothetical protein